MPKIEMLVVACLVMFLKNCQTVFSCDSTILHSLPTMYKYFSFSASSPAFVGVTFFFSYFEKHLLIFIVLLICTQ